MPTRIPADFDRVEPRSPFLALTGPFYEKRGTATLVLGLHVEDKHLNRRNVVHGGMICSLIDLTMGEAARRTTDPPREYVTASLTAEFAGNATTGDWLEAHADIVRAGRRVVFVNCFVYHGSERIARGSGTFIVVGASDDGPRVTTSDSVAARDPAATG